MYHFILQILIMLSLGVLVYLAARKIPQISDTVTEEVAGQPKGFWHQIELVLGKLPLDKFDLAISQFLEKNIRKMKLFLARLDNYLNEHLEQFKKVKHRAHRKQQKKFALFETTEEDRNVHTGETTSELTERTTETADTVAKEETELSKPSK